MENSHSDPWWSVSERWSSAAHRVAQHFDPFVCADLMLVLPGVVVIFTEKRNTIEITKRLLRARVACRQPENTTLQLGESVDVLVIHVVRA